MVPPAPPAVGSGTEVAVDKGTEVALLAGAMVTRGGTLTALVHPTPNTAANPAVKIQTADFFMDNSQNM